jgi:glutathione peroxidase
MVSFHPTPPQFFNGGSSTMRNIISAALLAAVLCAAASQLQADEKKDDKVGAALKFKMNTLDGKPVELSKYQGKVILLVNVASKCGNTPQYDALQKLYEKYGKEGLMVVGVPANNFGGQEPGSNEEIAKFCTSKYNVTFDMLAKVSVKGDDQCDLYKFLTSKDTDPKFSGEIQWNFEKFLINRKGEVVGRFIPKTKPDAKEVIEAIEAELAKK